MVSDRNAALISFSRPSIRLGQPLEHVSLDLLGALVALGLAGDRQRLGQLVGGHRRDRVVHVVAVVGEDRVLGGLLRGLLGQLLLSDAQRPDERLGGLEAFCDHRFGGRLRAGVDQFDDVLGGLGLDHHDRDVVTDDAAGDDHVEHRALELGDRRERHPGAVDQRHPRRADRPGERQAGQLGGRRAGVDREDVVELVGVQRQDRHHDLDLVAQAVDERRAQRAVDEPAGQDRVGGRPALAAEERAGNAPGRVHALFDVDGQREEVEMLLGLFARGRGREQHGLLVEVGDHRAGGLLREPAGFKTDGAGAEAPVVDGGGCFVDALVDFSYRHDSPGFPSFSCRRYAFAVASNLNGIGLNAATAVDRSGRISVRQPLPKTARAGWPLS